MCSIENNDANVFYEGFEMYAKYKHYNNVFGDHVPMILANALNIHLILVEESIDGLFTIEIVLSNCQDCKRTPLFLPKRPDHYNASVPFSIEPLWQHGHAHINGVLNADNADDEPNALLSNPTPLDEPSSLDDGHTDDVPDFLYWLQMHRKTHPTNLLSGSLNINSIRNKFSTVEYILQNAYVDIFGICETNQTGWHLSRRTISRKKYIYTIVKIARLMVVA